MSLSLWLTILAQASEPASSPAATTPSPTEVLPAQTPLGGTSGEAYGVLLRQMRAVPVSADRLELLRAAAIDGWFGCSQVAGLLRTFEVDEDRVQAAEILAPRTVDPRNAEQIASAFQESANADHALALFR